MFNSKYTGQQVEALLDQVSGGTVGGGVSQEQFDSAEHVVTASLVSLNKRVSTLESNSGSTGEAYDDTELRGLISGNTEAIEILSGRTISYNDLTDKPTIPTLPTFATINGSAITEGGDIVIEGGGVSEERFDGLDKATAEALTRIVDQYMTIAKAEKTYAKSKDVYTKTESEAKFIDQSDLNNVYTKTESDEKFLDNSELEQKLVDFMRSDAYHSIHDPQEKAIAAALNEHNDRLTVLESGGTGSSYDDTEVRNLISGNTTDIAALLARIEALETQLSGVTEQLDRI